MRLYRCKWWACGRWGALGIWNAESFKFITPNPLKYNELGVSCIKINNEMSENRNNPIADAIEAWLSDMDTAERQKPIYAARDGSGQQWSMEDLLREVRHQTPEGKRVEQGILLVALDMIYKGKKSIK